MGVGGWISDEGHAIPQRKRRIMAFGVSFSKKLKWHRGPGPGPRKVWELGVGVEGTKSIFAQGLREEHLCSFGLSFPASSCSQVVSPLGPRLGHGPCGQRRRPSVEVLSLRSSIK